MIYWIKGYDKLPEVVKARNEVRALVAKGLFINDYTIAGNEVRKQLVLSPALFREFLIDCNKFIRWEVKRKRPITTVRNHIVN